MKIGDVCFHCWGDSDGKNKYRDRSVILFIKGKVALIAAFPSYIEDGGTDNDVGTRVDTFGTRWINIKFLEKGE